MGSAPHDRRDGEPAASAARRLPVRLSCGALLLCAASFVLALVPYGARFEFSPALEGFGACVVKSEANAVAVPAPYAGEFLAAAAAASGLTEAEFVLTGCQIISVSTGVNLLSGEVSYTADNVEYVLERIIDTAEFPDWDDLTTEQKTAWSNNETNYNAARYNSFMDAFGLSDARERFYRSGGGDFDEGEESQLQRMGAIGYRWANGARCRVQDVLAAAENARTSNGLTALTRTENYDIVNAPSYAYLSGNEALNYGMDFRYYGLYQGAQSLRGIATNKPVTCWAGWRGYNSTTSFDMKMVVCSESPFYYNEVGNVPNVAARYQKIGDHVFYFAEHQFSTTQMTPINMAVNAYNSGQWNPAWVAYSVLFCRDGAPLDVMMPETPSTAPYEIEDYPGEYVGAPTQSPETTWPSMFSNEPGPEPAPPPYVPPGPDERPQNPYNPSNPDNPEYQSGTPEWKQDTTANLDAALHINFEKLFPFCLIYDLKMFVDKFRELVLEDESGIGEQAINDYEILRLPGLPIDGLEDGLEFDLEPLRNLLNLIRPVVFWLLLIYLLMSVIEFWRGILTGGD